MIAGSACPDLSAEAEKMHPTHYFVFACPSRHPDFEQLLNDLLAQKHLTILQTGDPGFNLDIAAIPRDLLAGIEAFGYGLSLTPMHFPTR
jgi:hypothetical protein